MDKFMELFHLASPEECLAFQLYLQAPPARADSSLPALQDNFRTMAIEWLIPLHLESKIDFEQYFRSPESLRRACWNRIFGEKEYNPRQLSAGFTPLRRCLEETIALRDLHAGLPTGWDSAYLLRALSGRYPEALYDKYLVQPSGPHDHPMITEAEIECNYQTCLEFHSGRLLRFKRLKQDHLDEEMEMLVQAHHWQKLLHLWRNQRWRVSYLNHQRVRGQILPISEPPPAEMPIFEHRYPVLSAYRRVENMLSGQLMDRLDWEKLLGILGRDDFPAHSPEGKELYNYAIQLGTGHYNQSDRDPEVAQQLLDLYQQGWASDALLTNRAIDPQHYLNACSLALRLGQTDTAEQLSQAWRGKLDSRARDENLEAFNLAHIAFYEREYDRAWKLSQTSNPKDIRKLAHYVLEIKILAERDPELAIHRIGTFLKFLARDELKLPANRLNNEKTRVLLARRVLNLDPNKAKSAAKLEKEIAAFAFDREWLSHILARQLGGAAWKI